MPAPRATLYYFHDPMCSWCWGYRPTWQRLKARLPQQIDVVNVLGGLAPDTDQPMPAGQQALIRQHWRRIAARLGTTFNFDFWRKNQPRRATFPACRAVIAAALQSREEAMIEAIQHAYYLRALNPSDTTVLVELARELELDVPHFERTLAAPETQRALLRDVNFARGAPINGFPSLVLQVGVARWPVPLDYTQEDTSLQAMVSRLRDAPPGQ